MKNRIAAILVTAMLSAVIISGCGQKASQNRFRTDRSRYIF